MIARQFPLVAPALPYGAIEAVNAVGGANLHPNHYVHARPKTSGRGSGVVGYNVQIAVDTEHHLIVTHEVTTTGSDRAQLAKMASQAKEVLHAEHLDVVADRGYFNSPEILACEQADISVTLPKPMTSVAKSDGRFGKQDFRYVAAEDVYICPAGERLAYHYTNEENGLVLRRYSLGTASTDPLPFYFNGLAAG